MKWTYNGNLHLYEMQEDDSDFSRSLKKNETNILAIITSEIKRPSRAKRPRCRFKLGLGGLKGYLYFNRLKDAKEFTEKTIEWMNNKKE